MYPDVSTKPIVDTCTEILFRRWRDNLLLLVSTQKFYDQLRRWVFGGGGCYINPSYRGATCVCLDKGLTVWYVAITACYTGRWHRLRDNIITTSIWRPVVLTEWFSINIQQTRLCFTY